jgi:hypothetical protein
MKMVCGMVRCKQSQGSLTRANRYLKHGHSLNVGTVAL